MPGTASACLTAAPRGVGCRATVPKFKDGAGRAPDETGWRRQRGGESYPEARPVRAYDVSAPNPAQRGHRRRKRARRSGNDYHAIRPHERRNRCCIDKPHRNGKRGCFWKRGITPATTGNRDVLPVFRRCKRHNHRTIHPYAGVSESASISITNDGGQKCCGKPDHLHIQRGRHDRPTLSSATAKLARLSGLAAVTTNEANGHAVCLCSNSATPLRAANLKTGTGAAYSTSVAVILTGAKSFSATGLSAATTHTGISCNRDGRATTPAIATSAGFTHRRSGGRIDHNESVQEFETGACSWLL